MSPRSAPRGCRKPGSADMTCQPIGTPGSAHELRSCRSPIDLTPATLDGALEAPDFGAFGAFGASAALELLELIDCAEKLGPFRIGQIEPVPRNAIALTDPAGSEELQQGTAEQRGRKRLHPNVGAEMVFRHRQQAPLRLGNDLLDSPDRLAVLREDLAAQQQPISR